jgi:hypothetical protein
MVITIGIDPGKNYCAVSKFIDTTLVFAKTVRSKLPWPHGAYEAAMQAIQLLTDAPGLTLGANVYCEFPVIRDTTISPNDQLPMCFMDGLLIMGLRPRVFGTVNPVLWKGSIKPEIITERVKLRLSAEELASCKTKDHNTFDAVGVGLVKLQRMHLGLA